MPTQTNSQPMSDEAPFAVGQRVALLTDIWDDGQDHHPPGYLARKGDVLVVRGFFDRGSEYPVLVSHEEVTDQSFRVAINEIKGEGRP